MITRTEAHEIVGLVGHRGCPIQNVSDGDIALALYHLEGELSVARGDEEAWKEWVEDNTPEGRERWNDLTAEDLERWVQLPMKVERLRVKVEALRSELFVREPDAK